MLLLNCVIHLPRMTLDRLVQEDLLSYIVEKLVVNHESLSIYLYQRKCIILALLIMVREMSQIKKNLGISRPNLLKFIIYFLHIDKLMTNIKRYDERDLREAEQLAEIRRILTDLPVIMAIQFDSSNESDKPLPSQLKGRVGVSFGHNRFGEDYGFDVRYLSTKIFNFAIFGDFLSLFFTLV